MAGKKIMVVLPPRDFDGPVFDTIRRVLEGRGHKVAVASVARGAVTSSDGMSVPVTVGIKDIKTWDYDAFIFVGGEGAKLYFDDPEVRKLAKDVKYKTVGATGNAAVILALSEVLEKKKAACPYEYADLVRRHGAVLTGRPLEVDDKIITLQDPAVAEQFANAIVNALK